MCFFFQDYILPTELFQKTQSIHCSCFWYKTFNVIFFMAVYYVFVFTWSCLHIILIIPTFPDFMYKVYCETKKEVFLSIAMLNLTWLSVYLTFLNTYINLVWAWSNHHFIQLLQPMLLFISISVAYIKFYYKELI